MNLKKLHIAKAMMIATTVIIVVFQCYWVTRLYRDEWASIKRETDVGFRDAIYKMQVSRFKKDTVIFKQAGGNVFNVEAINVLSKHASFGSGDSVPQNTVIKVNGDTAASKTGEQKGAKFTRTITLTQSPGPGERPPGFVFYEKNLGDSISYKNLDSVYDEIKERLVKMGAFENGQRVIFKGRPGITDSLPHKSLAEEKKPLTKKTNAKQKATGNNIQPSPLRIFTSRALTDSFSVHQVDSAYRQELNKTSIDIPFTIQKYDGTKPAGMDTSSKKLVTAPVPVGILKPVFYQASFYNATPFLFKRISLQMLLSLAIIAFTTLTFIFLYRNILAQQRLAVIKNDFISNITHELKTPIATVQVAIEAMKNFNALHDAEKTKDYLDISAIELQRLTLLVDKVLKLTMFEKKEIELHKEHFNIKNLADEVMQSMKLQFDKCHADVRLQADNPDLNLYADRLHILSVLYNLLDNAMKYCKTAPAIIVSVQEVGDNIRLAVEDNCVAIPSEYKNKVFEKFFRVPSGNQHNVKGYGLGLSYVAHIVQQHDGKIELLSEEGKGNHFIIYLPKY